MIKDTQTFISNFLVNRVGEQRMSEKDLIEELLKEIYRVKKEKVLHVEKLAAKIDGLIQLEQQARQNLMKATSNFEVRKWSAIVKSVAVEKTLVQEKRYLFKLLELEEGKLRERLATIEVEEEE